MTKEPSEAIGRAALRKANILIDDAHEEFAAFTIFIDGVGYTTECVALARVLQEHSDVVKAALEDLTHQEWCTAPYGYPDRCSCGFGKHKKALQSLILPDEPDTLVEQLARRFHEAYERLAPTYGYETRDETRHFDPESPNGKLMIAVVEELQIVPKDQS